jgi:hypothetical protein
MISFYKYNFRKDEFYYLDGRVRKIRYPKFTLEFSKSGRVISDYPARTSKNFELFMDYLITNDKIRDAKKKVSL